MLQETFTPRENDILSLILEGYSSTGIAERLVLAPETVRWYVKQIYSKLGVHSRDEAVARVRELRQLRPESLLVATPFTVRTKVESTFIGRGELLDQLTAVLNEGEQRLITLIGPPGVGKTRLSLELLNRRRQSLAETYFVDLSAETIAGRVALRITEALGVLVDEASSVISALQLRLRDLPTLLVLDNFEQVIDAAPQTAELCATCPHLTIVVTSREALRLSGEWVVEVPCLELPPDVPLAALSGVESVALFMQRARAASPWFRLTPENAAAVAEICTKLDGLPLALELAAARCRLLSPDELLERLESRLDLLSRGPRDVPARQATLRGAIQWSYDLLSESERQLFDRLGVFQGGWTLEAAEAIGAVQPSITHVFDVMAGIVAKSLATCREDRTGHIRFSFLETIREFAHERLAESGSAQIVTDAHARHYAVLAERANAQLVIDQQLSWYVRLEDEQDNYRAALRFAEATGDAELLMRLTGALGWYWFKQARVLDGRGWADSAVTHDRPDLPAVVRIDAYNAAGYLAYAQSEHSRAYELHLKALTIARETDDSLRQAFSLMSLSMQTRSLGDLALAYEQSAEALSIMVGIGHLPLRTIALNNLGMFARALGWRERASRHFRDGIALSLELRQVSHQTYLYLNLGDNLIEDDPIQAREFVSLGLDCARAVGDPRMIADALGLMSSLSRKNGDQTVALTFADEGLKTARSVVYRSGIVFALTEMAQAYFALGSARQAEDALRAAGFYADETDDLSLQEAVQHTRIELGFISDIDIPPIQGGDSLA